MYSGQGRMVMDICGDQGRLLATYKERLSRVERGEVWGSDHPGPYTAEERATEIQRIRAAIACLEEQSGKRSIEILRGKDT
jgi:hypothetical protein